MIQTVHSSFLYLPSGVLPGSIVKMRGHLIAHGNPHSAPRLVRCPRPLVSTYSSERGTTWPLSSASEEVEPTPDHFSGRSTDCQSSNESPKKDSIADVQGALILNASIPEPPGILDRGSAHLELTMPSDIRSCRTVHSFKRHLKTHNSNNYCCLNCGF